MTDELVQKVSEYLDSLPHSLWARYFDLSQPASRTEAAEWMAAEMRKILPTGADRYFESRMRHPAYKAAYDSAKAEVEKVERPSWNAYFLNIARAVSARADCTRAQHGAVIVDQYHRIISTGYNGPPPGDNRSCTAGDCPRACSDEPHNSGGYENCIANHAEQNACANATRDMRGGTIYVTGQPCGMCAKLISAAGLVAVW